MAAFCMLSYGMVGYLWWITHNELRFMGYWLMSIFNMVQDKTEKGLEKYKKRISLGVGVLMFLFVFKLKNRSKPSRMKAVRFPIFMRL